ncbi:MAG TPA: BTAD domain-containing putative transcriptional regulator [Micromonosporaceae bacterium]|nr:BTAD domain-containing putative transcriptional regulator [Micromonosporaceae bacterium]
MAEYRLLGPVQTWAQGHLLEGGQPRQRAVLAALLVDAGQVVGWDTLVHRVWGQMAPADARGSARAHISRIRRTLREPPGRAGAAAADPLVHEYGGYVLKVDPECVDLHRFRRLVHRARGAGCDQDRVALLRKAVALWRGEALAGIPGDWAARTREGLAKERLDAVVAWAGAELAVHNPAALVGPLTDLTGQYPLVEPLTAALMRTLHALGHTASAIEEYAGLRDRLADELGIDPGHELQSLHLAMLRGDPVPLGATAGLRRAAPTPAVGERRPAPWPAVGEGRPAPAPLPAQLPADLHGFAGREAALAHLDALAGEAAAAPTAVTISAVSGTAGIGKTALAVHWAHRVTDRFPDGQLYVNLRGFDPGGAPMSPAEVLRGFLDALGVPAGQIPAGTDDRAALYRSLLAGRRVLVLLDNARDAEQVRPLLPGTPLSMVVVTSRDRLTSLVTAYGARPLALDLLSPQEGRQLLAHRLGAARVAAEPEPVEQIVAACARLPLALAIAAARAQQTNFPLATIAAELDDTRGRLDVLDAGEPNSQVRAVLSWSYATLTQGAARLFRLLGLHLGPDISASAAASLCCRPVPETRRLCAELVRASLLAEPAPGRYAFHDLLRAYAAEQAYASQSHAESRAALTRLLDHHMHTAHTAARVVDPHRDPIPIPLTTPVPGAAPQAPADHQQAMAWFASEHQVLLAALRHAAESGHDTHAWQLAWALDPYLDRRGHWHDRAAAWHTALRAAYRLDNLPAQAEAHRSLAHNNLRLDQPASAEAHLVQALLLYARLGDLTGQAFVHGLLAHLRERQSCYCQALDHARQALTRYRAARHDWGQATARTAVGRYYTLLGEPAIALRYCQDALVLLQQLGDRYGTAAAWASLGHAHHHLDHHAEAADCYGQALALLGDLGYRAYEAETLTHLGDAHQAAGDLDAARAAWQRALEILTGLSHGDAEPVRTRISELAGAGHARPPRPRPSPGQHRSAGRRSAAGPG